MIDGPSKLECLTAGKPFQLSVMGHSSLSGPFLSFKENEVSRFCEHESLSILGRDKVLFNLFSRHLSFSLIFFSKIVTFGMT